MNLSRINGNSYYIPGSTNIGVFLFKDKYTLLIDSGESNQDARKIQENLMTNNLNIKYIINTHSHIDHCGGNVYLKESYPGSLFYSSPNTQLFVENAFLFPLYLYAGNPPLINYHFLLISLEITVFHFCFKELSLLLITSLCNYG